MRADEAVMLDRHGPVRGEIRVPGDKSISHRALMLGALASGPTTIAGLSNGLDVAHTANALRALGIQIDGSPDLTTVHGGEFLEPGSPLDMGNAGTGLRLMCGLVAGAGHLVVLSGDESLSKRPMRRVIDPLRQMGASIHARRGGIAPLVMLPSSLHGIEYSLPVPSAQVKGAILLAGLQADGSTTVIESVPSRNHTEEMLAHFGAEITVEGSAITVRKSQLLSRHLSVPGDPSQAAFWAVAAAIVPDSHVILPNLELSPTRTGFLEVLRRMGAAVSIKTNSLEVTYNDRLRAVEILPDDVPSMIDEIPVLAIAAATAAGTSVFRGLSELAHKESNRLENVWALVRSLGAACEIQGESLVIKGVSEFMNASSTSHGDHRMTMSAAIASLLCKERSELSDTQFVATSYPRFFAELDRVTKGAR